MSRMALGKIVMDTLDVCSRSGDGRSDLQLFKLSKYSHYSVVQLLNATFEFLHPGPSRVLQVADALCLRLSSSDLLEDGGNDEGGGESRENLLVTPPGRQTSGANPLLISC